MPVRFLTLRNPSTVELACLNLFVPIPNRSA